MTIDNATILIHNEHVLKTSRGEFHGTIEEIFRLGDTEELDILEQDGWSFTSDVPAWGLFLYGGTKALFPNPTGRIPTIKATIITSVDHFTPKAKEEAKQPLDRAHIESVVNKLLGKKSKLTDTALLQMIRSRGLQPLKGLHFSSFFKLLRREGRCIEEHEIDSLIIDCMTELENQGYKITRNQFASCFWGAINTNPRDELKDYFEALRWDGVKRIDTWLTTYLKVEDNALNRTLGAKWLISGAARAIKPGAPVEGMLVLRGSQGIGKSSALYCLAPSIGGKASYVETKLDPSNVKAMGEVVGGTFLIEWGELAGMSKNDMNDLKRALTTSEDKYRPAYGRIVCESARRCIFAATTNSQEILRDETGNRRFWIVDIEATTDREGLERDKDQLWAEALYRFKLDTHPRTWTLSAPELTELEKRNESSRVINHRIEAAEARLIAELANPTQSAGNTSEWVTGEWAYDSLCQAFKLTDREYSSLLAKAGLTSERRYVNGERCRVWLQRQ